MGKINSLTGIRGFAAIWVLLFHAVKQNVTPALDTFFARGESGVNLFFVLSGFVMCYVYSEKMKTLTLSGTRQYLWKRFARIYPSHLAVLLILLVIMTVARALNVSFEENYYTVRKFLLQIFLLNGIGLPDSGGWNFASWTLSQEFVAYFAFPFLILWINRLSQWQSLVAIIVIFGINFALAFIVNDGESYYLPWSFALTRIATLFTVGCLAYNLSTHPFVKKISPWVAPITFLSVFAVASLYTHEMAYGVLSVLYTILILSMAADNSSILNKFFSSKPMIFLGEISYSIYIAQIVTGMLFMQVIRRVAVLGELTENYAFFEPAVCLVAGTIAGAMLHYWLEIPAGKWLNQNGSRIYKWTIGSITKRPS